MNIEHIRGDKDCPACCCRQGYYHPECGGKWHESIVDYDEDDYYHNYKCDKCDEEDYQHGYEDSPIIFKDKINRGKYDR